MNQKSEHTVAEKLFILMAWKLNGMCQSSVYLGWSDEYSRMKNKEYWNSTPHPIKGHVFTISDLQQVSAHDLWLLGFRDWDGNNSLLLPLWLYNHMDQKEVWKGISGKTKTLFNIDLVTRGGCLAYWFKHEPVALIETEEPEKQPVTVSELAQDDPDALAWIGGMPGDDDDSVVVVHPYRDDEHQ